MKQDNLAIHLSISVLVYLFLGIVGLVGYLSEPSTAATCLYFVTVGLITLAVMKITNCFGLVPSLSKSVDKYAEAVFFGLTALIIVVLLFNGYMPMWTGWTMEFIKLW